MVTMWLVARAPLIWGGDPMKSNRSTLALLSNQAALDIQTTTCRNRLLPAISSNTSVVWAAQSSKAAGGRVVALFNLADTAATVSAAWSALALPHGVSSSRTVELWGRGSLLTVGASSLGARLEPHDAVLVEITPTTAAGSSTAAASPTTATGDDPYS